MCCYVTGQVLSKFQEPCVHTRSYGVQLDLLLCSFDHAYIQVCPGLEKRSHKLKVHEITDVHVTHKDDCVALPMEEGMVFEVRGIHGPWKKEWCSR